MMNRWSCLVLEFLYSQNTNRSKTELSGAQRSVDLASSRGGWGQVHRSTMNQIQGKKKPTVSSAVCTRLRLMDRRVGLWKAVRQHLSVKCQPSLSAPRIFPKHRVKTSLGFLVAFWSCQSMQKGSLKVLACC
ncbi:rCG39021 [Rattus norvegicus]|uniref:RCG39021 n=1 Tax=Rattus norvegicus TaxID=10116 RepID=A6JY84_RAT|nr:rCG39021 [Rattus norvegicus]